jgi:hypothetical protein
VSQRNTFELRTLRSLTMGARRVLPGSTIHVDAATAVELIRAGDARLVDDADLALLLDTAPRRVTL